MQLLSRMSFGTNHKHRAGWRKQQAGRRYQVVSAKSKELQGKYCLPPCANLWLAFPGPFSNSSTKSARPIQPFLYKGEDFPQVITSPNHIAIMKTC